MNILRNKQLKITILALSALALLTAGILWYFSSGNVQGVRAGWWNDPAPVAALRCGAGNWSYRKNPIFVISTQSIVEREKSIIRDTC